MDTKDLIRALRDIPPQKHVLPPGLQEGGLWLDVIRIEIRKARANEAACVQVLKRPPAFLRWLLKTWLRFPAPSQIE